MAISDGCDGRGNCRKLHTHNYETKRAAFGHNPATAPFVDEVLRERAKKRVEAELPPIFSPQAETAAVERYQDLDPTLKRVTTLRSVAISLLDDLEVNND